MKKRVFATPEEVDTVHNLLLRTPVNVTIKRDDFVERTGLPLRVIRDAIAQLIKLGIPIIADRKATGYRVSDDPTLIVPLSAPVVVSRT